MVVGVAGPVLHLLAPVNLTIWHSRLGEGCLMTHISRNKYEGEGPSIWGVGCRSGRVRSPGSRRERREKSHRNKAAPLQQRRRRGPINWDPWAAMPATSQGKTPRLRSVAAVLLLRQWAGDLEASGGVQTPQSPSLTDVSAVSSSRSLRARIDGRSWVGGRPRGSKAAIFVDPR